MTQVRTNLQKTLLQRLANIKSRPKKGLLQKGFTLIELLIVVAILGVLFAVALPNFVNQADTARVNAANAAVKAAANACAAARITGTETDIASIDGVTGSCTSGTAAVTFTSDTDTFETTTAATATVTGTASELTTSATKT